MKHRIGLLALAAFVIVDIGLFLAVRQHVQADAAPPADDISATVPGPASSDPDDSDDPAAAGAQRLELAGPGVLARVSPGRCTNNSKPLIEISNDSGASFEEIALPLLEPADSNATVRTVLKVRADSADEIAVIASNEKCQARQFTTEDGGSSWQESKVKGAKDARDDWYIDATGTGVVSTDDATEPGCDVVALAPVSDLNAKVACTDGVIGGTNDRGAEWVRLGQLDGVSGVVFDTVGEGFGVAPDGDCEARLFTTVDAGGQWTPAGCVSSKTAASSLVGSGARLFALVGDEVRISEDAGESWDDPEEPSDG